VRQLSPVSNLVLAVLAALVLLTTLDFPWVSPAVTDPVSADGPVERAAFQLGHVFAPPPEAASGNVALGGYRFILVGLAAVLVLLCLLAAIPATRDAVREPLRAAALTLPVAVAYLVIARPGNAGESIQWGSLLGLVVAAMAGNAAWHGARIRSPRRRPEPLAGRPR
jgi:hypothetical protein